MNAEILDDLKQINVLLAKQEQSIRQITQINHTQNVQYVQQIHNIQHIQQIQSRVNAQVEKTGTALKKTSGLFGGFKTVAATVGGAITGAFSALGAGGFLAEAVTEADALADKFLVLRLSLGKLKSAIGEAVAPIISAFLPMVQQAVYAATRLVNTIGKVIAALFGGTVQTEDMAAAQKDLAASSGKAARSLASFDEIERLDKGSGSSGGSTAEVTLPKVQDPLTPQLQAVVDSIRAAMNKIRELLAPLKEIDFSPAAEAFSRLRQAVEPFGKTLFAGLEWAWHNLLVPLAKWTAEKVLPAFLDLLSGALAFLNSVVTALKPLAVWLWESFLQPVGKWAGDVVVAAIKKLTATLEGLSDWISKNQGLIKGAVDLITTLVGVWKVTDLIMWIDSVGGVTNALKLLTPEILKNTTAKIASKAEDIAIIALYAGDFVKAIGGKIIQLAKETAAWIGNTAAKAGSTAAEWAQIAATTAWNALCAVATTVTTAFGAAMVFLTSPIGLVTVAITALIAIVTLLIKNWDAVKAAAVSTWESITATFSAAGAWFQQNVVAPVMGVFSNMWTGLQEKLKSPLNGIIGFLNQLLMGITSGINAMIRSLNALSFTVPDWVPILGGESFGFQLSTVKTPQIPYLAQGAVLPANKPFLAVVGDQKRGTNIEAPLATIQEAVASVMDGQIDAMLAGFEALLQETRQLRSVVESIEVGDTVIGQAAARYDRRRTLARGGVL